MSTSQLILKIAECLHVVTIEHMKQGDKAGEEFLRRLQLLWIQERPLILQNQN